MNDHQRNTFLKALTELCRSHNIYLEGCSGMWFHIYDMPTDHIGRTVLYSEDTDGCIDFWEKWKKNENE